MARTDLLRGTLDLLILQALTLDANHGLGVARRVEQLTRGAFQVNPGSLFPALHRLEQRGWLKSEWGASASNRKAKYLPAHGGRAPAAEGRNGELGAHLDGDHQRLAPGRGGVMIRHFLRNLFRRDRVERELSNEIDGVIDLLIEEKVAQGMSSDEARRAARLEIGRVEHVKDNVRDVRAGVWLDALRQDARFGVRTLLRRPGFAAVLRAE